MVQCAGYRGKSTVMEDNEQPPAPITEASAPEVVERPLWPLSRDEQRVLIITFVGGLASIVAGACVIGGAIAMTRYLKKYNSLSQLIILTGINILGTAVSFYFHRHSPGVNKWVVWFVLLVVLVPTAIYLLGLIGVAAGIH